MGANRWGKSEIRVSKLYRGEDGDDISDVTVQVLVEGDVEAAHLHGDNSAVLPTDTMRNTVYALAQDHLTKDLEAFGVTVVDHFLARSDVHLATVRLSERVWQRATATGFVGGNAERREARVVRGRGETGTWAGIDGLVLLKTTGSGFSGFPRDEFTTLAETEDRILSTSVTTEWRYQTVPSDTTSAWAEVREAVVGAFFDKRSASVQHQGWMMAEAALDAVPEIAVIRFRLPNQHHLRFDLTPFEMIDQRIVFQPVSEPYGDIGFTVSR